MNYEVEQKYAVADLAILEQRLAALGARPGRAVTQVDCYYAHPSRDFVQTDEALRIRRVGPKNVITYKGPKVDTATKTRRELELPLPPEDAGALGFDELLTSLGFAPAGEIRKDRRTAQLSWQGKQVEIALDDVAHLGRYVELELTADEANLPSAREALASLALALNLTAPERRSYLELLLGS